MISCSYQQDYANARPVKMSVKPRDALALQIPKVTGSEGGKRVGRKIANAQVRTVRPLFFVCYHQSR